MFRLSIGLFFLLVSAQTAASAAEPGTKAARRAPESWSTEERIAARVDPRLASDRVARAARDATKAPAPGRRVADVIRGREQPELLLPTQVFEATIRHGFLNAEVWREVHAGQLAAAGLPTTFWDEMAEVAAPFIQDLRLQRAALLRSHANPAEKDQVAREIAGGAATLCRDRVKALRAARARYGPALDRFMYQYVAPGITITTDQPWDAEMLRRQEAGCE